tara:strand:+ start:1247 stop:2959 length:1713 start_codon:yes stop_codon:yes gene_type:complete
VNYIVVENISRASLIVSCIDRFEDPSSWSVLSTDGVFEGLHSDGMPFKIEDKSFLPKIGILNSSVFSRLSSAFSEGDKVYSAFYRSPLGEFISSRVESMANKCGASFYRIKLGDLSSGLSYENIDVSTSLVSYYLSCRLVENLSSVVTSKEVSSRIGTVALERHSGVVLSILAKNTRLSRSTVDYQISSLLESGALAESTPIPDRDKAERAMELLSSCTPEYQEVKSAEDPPSCFGLVSLCSFLSSRYGFSPSYSAGLLESLMTRKLVGNSDFETKETSIQSFDKGVSFITKTAGADFIGDASDRYFGLFPLDPSITPSSSGIKGDLRTVYASIWFRALASQSVTSITQTNICTYRPLEGSDLIVEATSTELVKPGWHKVSSFLFSSPSIPVSCEETGILESSLHTKTPYKFGTSLSDVVGFLDSSLILRPSNVSIILDSLVEFDMVTMSRGLIQITPKGEACVTFLRQVFPDFIDPDFHAEIEEELDRVLLGELSYVDFSSYLFSMFSPYLKKIRSSFLRPSFKSPSNEPLRVWVDPYPRAYSPSNKWSCDVSFDSRGRILPSESVKES